MPTRSSFANARRALITGASSGIGEAAVKAFAQAGFSVAMVARSAQKLEALAHELMPSEGAVKAFPMDLADLADIGQKVSEIESTFGPIDVLINSAGMGYTRRLSDTSLSDWQQVIDTNLTSVFETVKAVLPGMRERADGLIINIASIAAHEAFENWGAYGVSKAALVALSRAIAKEEATNGIRVVTLSLGAVNTPIWDADTVQADFDRSLMLDAKTVAQTILHTALLPADAVISELTLTPAQGAL